MNMGVWYFLEMAVGIGLFLYGVFHSSRRTPYRKISLLMAGTVMIGFSLYMFMPGSSDTMAEILGL